MKKLGVFKKIACCAAVVALGAGSLVGLTACTKYDLVYANWNFGTESSNNVERQMVKEFEKQNKVKIKLMSAPDGDNYQEYLQGRASAKQFPDVFMSPNMDFGFKNGYFEDLTSLVNADTDFAGIHAVLKDGVKYQGHTFAIPFAVHMAGYFANTSLFEDNGVDQLADNYTLGNFFDAIDSFATKTGVIGLGEEISIIDWYPAVKTAGEDTELGWYAFDGENYRLDGDVYKEGMTKTLGIYNDKKSYLSIMDQGGEDRTATSNTAFGGDYGWHGAAFYGNKVGLRYDGTWAIDDIKKNSTEFTVKFIGLPGGKSVLIPDILGIAPGLKTERKQLAYNFAKWMSFSSEGFGKRVDIIKAENEKVAGSAALNTLPLINTEKNVERAKEALDLPGVWEAFANLDDAIVELTKLQPGYELSRFNANTGITYADKNESNITVGRFLDLCRTGKLTYADKSYDLQLKANVQRGVALEAYNDLYKNIV